MKKVYSNADLEEHAIMQFLRNCNEDYDKNLMVSDEQDSVIDLIYNGIKYQITAPADEAEVHNRIVNRQEESVSVGNIKGSFMEISPGKKRVPSFKFEHTPDDAWENFVIRPILKKKLHDGKEVILLIYSSVFMPNFLNDALFQEYKEKIPHHTFDKVVIVDCLKNYYLPKS